MKKTLSQRSLSCGLGRQNTNQGQRFQSAGFTLMELLVVMAVIAIIAALLLPSLSRAKGKAQAISCLSQTRQIGLAVKFYTDDNEDQIPRSQHSAAANGQRPWERVLATFLGCSDSTWTNLLRGVYHCPADHRTNALGRVSYGINVYFELGAEDDYDGKPQTWHRLQEISKPAGTVFFTEVATATDHVMCEYWTSLADAEGEVAGLRHGQRSNFLFADIHAEGLPLDRTYKPPQLDRWNPAMAW